MNNVLAVTADLKRCSVAVRYNNRVFSIDESLDSSTYLVPVTKALLDENNIELSKMERLITSSGPGSFTGIRTAQSFIKGLSLALGIPAFCCSYFDVIKNIFGNNKFVAVIKSEKNQIYFKDFSSGLYGVTPFQKLEENISSDLPLAGDKIEEILNFTNRKFTEVSDFKKAKCFLEIEALESEIKPIYINAQTK